MNSSFLFTLIQFIFAFSVIAIIHELGHYLMAKSGKIEVEEFGLGFPPRAVKIFQYKETLFSLNWIPFGAFVRPKGKTIRISRGDWPQQAPGNASACFWVAPSQIYYSVSLSLHSFSLRLERPIPPG